MRLLGSRYFVGAAAVTIRQQKFFNQIDKFLLEPAGHVMQLVGKGGQTIRCVP